MTSSKKMERTATKRLEQEFESRGGIRPRQNRKKGKNAEHITCRKSREAEGLEEEASGVSGSIVKETRWEEGANTRYQEKKPRIWSPPTALKGGGDQSTR